MLAQFLVLFTFCILIAGILEVGRQRSQEIRRRAARVIAYRESKRATRPAPRHLEHAA